MKHLKFLKPRIGQRHFSSLRFQRFILDLIILQLNQISMCMFGSFVRNVEQHLLVDLFARYGSTNNMHGQDLRNPLIGVFPRKWPVNSVYVFMRMILYATFASCLYGHMCVCER